MLPILQRHTFHKLISLMCNKLGFTSFYNEDDDLDDGSYPILNKELRKQIFIFERELLKVEQLFMISGIC